MKPRPVDECLVASAQIIATTRDELAQLQFSIDAYVDRIEVSYEAIVASQALLAKLNDNALALAGEAADGANETAPAPTSAAP